MGEEILELIKRIQAISETGLQYSQNEYDLDRYNIIQNTALTVIEMLSHEPIEKIKLLMQENDGYKTPKIDVRAAVFNDKDEILLVQEKKDQSWSLPGGFADIGYTPSQIAEKETMEEAGIEVKAQKLVAVFDKGRHNHPKGLIDAYKIFFICKWKSGKPKAGMETLDAGFFSEDNLPSLSTPRNTPEQVKEMFKYHRNERKAPLFD